MATASSSSSFFVTSSLLPTGAQTLQRQHSQLFCLTTPSPLAKTSKRTSSFKVPAAKLPPGVEVPKVQPKFQAPFLGFTTTAEIWNSRACMIGLIGVFIVELIINKGILQVIGVDVGKGLDLPL